MNSGNLNRKQEKAVAHKEGPLLVIAGAGTGKTRVITERIARLIREGDAKPEEILGLTFTDKAAGEMEERVDNLLNESYVELWIMTFHSFAQQLLKSHGLDIGLPTDFTLLDETSAWLLIRKNLNRFELDYYQPLGQPSKFIRALVSHFSCCKDQGISPEAYLNYAEKVKDPEEKKRIREIARAYKTYQQLLLEKNCFDFGDLINYSLRLFQKRKKILSDYRNRFKYILVDEFQDTNRVQYDLMRLISAPKNNLMVSSDDDQSIYKFRGASFGNINQFRKDYPNAEKIVLVNNYRSKQEILDISYQLIQNNNPNRLEYLEGIDKKLISQRGDGAEIRHLHYQTLEGEIQGVIAKIIELKNKDKKTNFSDFAILVRAKKSADPFCRGLERAGIPYQFLALRGLYYRPVILDIISFFKLLDDYYENPALYRVLNIPCFDISGEDLSLLVRERKKRSLSFFKLLGNISALSGISKQGQEKMIFVHSLIRKHKEMAKNKNVSEVFVSFLEESGYLDYLARINDLESIRNINNFYDKIRSFENANQDAALPNFIQELELELESGEQGHSNFKLDEAGNVVRVMTIHSAKGLEFKYVFLVNLVHLRFPAVEKKDPIEIPEPLVRDIIPEGDVHLQEERRLFYVGMTRAQDGLFLTSALDYGGKRKKKISRFLIEAGFNSKEPKQERTLRRAEKKPENKQKLTKLPDYFSFTQFRAFQSCPLQYKFAHILRIPVKGKAVFTYGRTMHNTLEQFLARASKRKVTIDDLLHIYEEQWVNEWFYDKEEERKYFKQGRVALNIFYSDFVKNGFRVLKIKNEPALEKSFSLKINGNTIRGKIDRIDQLEGGVEIIDYKTGNTKEKLSQQDKEQLLIYQIAAEKALGLKPKLLSYYYLDGGKKLSFIGEKSDKEKQERNMLELIEEIKKSRFEPTPGWHCKFCDFKTICEHASEQ